MLKWFRKFGIQILDIREIHEIRIFKCPRASPNVTELNIQKIPNIKKNFGIFKFDYPNILKDIQVSWGISQCHRVEYPENSEYPEKFLDIQIWVSQYP